MRKNKNKPETVDTASVTETEEIKVPKKEKKENRTDRLSDHSHPRSRRSGSILFHGTSETDLHNQELSRKCSGNEL